MVEKAFDTLNCDAYIKTSNKKETSGGVLSCRVNARNGCFFLQLLRQGQFATVIAGRCLFQALHPLQFNELNPKSDDIPDLPGMAEMDELIKKITPSKNSNGTISRE